MSSFVKGLCMWAATAVIVTLMAMIALVTFTTPGCHTPSQYEQMSDEEFADAAFADAQAFAAVAYAGMRFDFLKVEDMETVSKAIGTLGSVGQALETSSVSDPDLIMAASLIDSLIRKVGGPSTARSKKVLQMSADELNKAIELVKQA